MAAGPPPQSPGLTLPGAEYFALAPNRSPALGQRRFMSGTSGLTSVGAAIQATSVISLQVSSSFGYGDGLFLVRAYVLFIPNDTSNKLQINQVRMGLGQTGTAIVLDMGIPTATLSAPPLPIIAIYERDALVVQSDLPSFPVNTPLFMDFQLTAVNNDATNPHSYTTNGIIVFHEVKGFVA